MVAPLLYPNKSHRKPVTLPRNSAIFAEFFGIMMGDGGINNPWQANITLNSEADADYVLYVTLLCNELFNALPRVKKRDESRAILISLASTTVVDFLVKKGLPRGNKLKSGLRIPFWIMRNKRYKIACVRGLMDTDGGLYIHKHCVLGKSYSNITLCFSSSSPMLIEQVAYIFVELGILPHINKAGKNIYLYSEKAIAKYLKIFGTSNTRISRLYEKWRDGRVV